jgi:hypothetical protein
MAIVQRLRQNLSALILWCVFLALYLGGAFLLVIGLVFAARTWWSLIHQHAGLWAVCAKTAELFVMAAGFFLIMVIPFIQRRAGQWSTSWRVERRSETKGQVQSLNRVAL